MQAILLLLSNLRTRRERAALDDESFSRFLFCRLLFSPVFIVCARTSNKSRPAHLHFAPLSDEALDGNLCLDRFVLSKIMFLRFLSEDAHFEE